MHALEVARRLMWLEHGFQEMMEREIKPERKGKASLWKLSDVWQSFWGSWQLQGVIKGS